MKSLLLENAKLHPFLFVASMEHFMDFTSLPILYVSNKMLCFFFVLLAKDVVTRVSVSVLLFQFLELCLFNFVVHSLGQLVLLLNEGLEFLDQPRRLLRGHPQLQVRLRPLPRLLVHLHNTTVFDDGAGSVVSLGVFLWWRRVLSLVQLLVPVLLQNLSLQLAYASNSAYTEYPLLLLERHDLVLMDRRQFVLVYSKLLHDPGDVVFPNEQVRVLAVVQEARRGVLVRRALRSLYDLLKNAFLLVDLHGSFLAPEALLQSGLLVDQVVAELFLVLHEVVVRVRELPRETQSAPAVHLFLLPDEMSV